MADDVTLREYLTSLIQNIEDKLDAQAEYTMQHFKLNELAIKKAEDSMTMRLESMNEFREQLQNERQLLATKENLDSVSKDFENRIRSYEEARADYATKENLVTQGGALDLRLKSLERANSFSSGKLWMVMAGFATIPTILALIAMFRSK
jgi:hypothetical protein